jgi:hypothetical protein
LSFRDRQRLDDITAAIEAIHDHLERDDLSDGLAFDATKAAAIGSASCRTRS